MIARLLAAGETLFAEGEPSDFVAVIESGRLAVIRRAGGREIELAQLGAGEFAGEMSVLERRPRAATVRALEPTRVTLLGREGFLERVARDHELALRLLVSLSERLHRADLALTEAAVRQGREPEPVPTRQGTELCLRLFAETAALAQALPHEGLAIARLPFAVGRRPAADELPPRLPVDLVLEDREPYRLSRYHFRLERAGDGVAVVDATSTLGTLVDGLALGEPFGRARVVLGPGEHRIVAGGIDSPFVFRLRVGTRTSDRDAAGP